jgi:peroxiredoxin
MPTLTQRLSTLRELYAGKIKPEIAEKLERHLAELRSRNYTECIPKVGTPAPSFSLKNQQGVEVSSARLLQDGPLVVSFFRGTWCPYCNLELAALASAYDAFRAAGAKVVLITPQSAESARGYLAQHDVPFPVLVDPDAQVAEAFGLAYTFPEYLKELYVNVFSNDLESLNAGGTWRLPIPGRFVIGADGLIADAQADPDYRFRPDPEDTLAVLDRLRVTSTTV